jgi:prefoldin subunit 5
MARVTFSKTVCWEAYLIDKAFGIDGVEYFGDIKEIVKVNSTLEQMYSYAKSFGFIDFIRLPESLCVSAKHVVNSGPHKTHYIDEALAYASDALDGILNGHTDFLSGHFFRNALSRAEQYFSICIINEETKQLNEELALSLREERNNTDNLNAQVAELRLKVSELIASIDALNKEFRLVQECYFYEKDRADYLAKELESLNSEPRELQLAKDALTGIHAEKS